jgi:hypothetical protein
MPSHGPSALVLTASPVGGRSRFATGTGLSAMMRTKDKDERQ